MDKSAIMQIDDTLRSTIEWELKNMNVFEHNLPAQAQDFNKLTKAEKAPIIDAVLQAVADGMNYNDISIKFGVPRQRISKWVWNKKQDNTVKVARSKEKAKPAILNKDFDDAVNEMIAENGNRVATNAISDARKLQTHASSINFSYEKMLDGYIELREAFAFEECLGDQLDEYFTKIEGFIKGIEAAANIILNADI